jgi:hypothetical protein
MNLLLKELELILTMLRKIKDSNGEINLQIDKSFLHDNVD